VPTTGTVRIVKQTVPAGGSGFPFSDDLPGSPGSFTLSDGEVETFSAVPAGTYTVSEADPAATPSGYTLTDVTCDDTDSTGDPAARSATVRLQAGEVVTCTFRNLLDAAGGSLFVFHLSGDQEVPPVPSPSRGGCFGRLDSGAAMLALVCVHDEEDATVMHVHRGAAGSNGEVLFDLGDPTSPVEGVWTGITPTEIADLLAGNLYVNIHTAGRPAGEIRGQMLPRTVDSFGFAASGAQEVPPNGSPAVGSCSADLADDAGSVLVQCAHAVPNPTAAHLHQGEPGEEGPVVFDFGSGNPFAGEAPLTPRLVADFAAGFLYVDVHSVDAPDGEIRGQLIAGQGGALAIPTLGEWALLGLALALAGLGVRRLAAG
jgi:hypothetical protein